MRYRSATVAGFHGLPFYPEVERNGGQAHLTMRGAQGKKINISSYSNL
jgi:hypothetical protein